MKEEVLDQYYELGEDDILPVKLDRLFHDLLNEHEMDTLEWVVAQILNCSIDDIHNNVRVSNIRLVNKSRDDKQKYVDLIVYYDDMIIVIELNNSFNGNYLRNVLYTMNAINNAYIEKDDYTTRNVQGILLNLNWTRNARRTPKEEIVYPYPTDDRKGKKPEYLLKIVNINLDYYARESYNGKCDRDVLYKLFTRMSKKELKKIVDNEEKLVNYYNKMDYLSHNKEYCKMIWDERIERNLRNQEAYYGGKKDGIEEGIKKGIEEGINQNRTQMILNLYNNGVSLDLISKASELTIDEVKEIIEKNKE